MTSKTVAQSNPERWGACGILLSLDCIETLVRPMGLQLDPVRLKTAVREAVITSRGSFEQGNTEPTFSGLVVKSIRSSFGDVGTAHFVSWFTSDFTFDVEDHRPWQMWHSAFVGFASNLQSWSGLGLPAAFSTRLYDLYNSIMFRVDIWGLWKKAQAHALSDWDLEMYSIHRFSDDLNSPFDWVVLTYETYSFRQFWREVVKTLTEQDLNNLWEHLRNDPELSPESYLRVLPHPSVLKDEELA